MASPLGLEDRVMERVDAILRVYEHWNQALTWTPSLTTRTKPGNCWQNQAIPAGKALAR